MQEACDEHKLVISILSGPTCSPEFLNGRLRLLRNITDYGIVCCKTTDYQREKKSARYRTSPIRKFGYYNDGSRITLFRR